MAEQYPCPSGRTCAFRYQSHHACFSTFNQKAYYSRPLAIITYMSVSPGYLGPVLRNIYSTIMSLGSPHVCVMSQGHTLLIKSVQSPWA